MPGMSVQLRREIEALADGKAALRENAAALSLAYREKTGQGRRLAVTGTDALSYACARMPATFAATERALSLALEQSACRPRTVTDCGAGTGAAALAAFSLLGQERTLCLEREEAMRDLGSRITKMAGVPAAWKSFDLLRDDVPPAELVCEGYMLGELAPEDRARAILRLWNAAGQMLLLVEPGTPQGFAVLREARNLLLQRGAAVAAPCPGNGDCPMGPDDWCHFSVRVERTRLMKQLKGGDAPFEDEKFSFLALTKEEAVPCAARILRHPEIARGRISLALCTPDGRTDAGITKKDPLWKRARKAQWGDALDATPGQTAPRD